MNIYKSVINADVAFHQILNKVLTEGLSPSLGKLKEPLVIKVNHMYQKIKKLNHLGI
jgi:hypothetical protein